jgi:hypothetical protein
LTGAAVARHRPLPASQGSGSLPLTTALVQQTRGQPRLRRPLGPRFLLPMLGRLLRHLQWIWQRWRWHSPPVQTASMPASPLHSSFQRSLCKTCPSWKIPLQVFSDCLSLPLFACRFRRHSQLGAPFAMRWLIASHFVLPCLASPVASWCRDCQQCQRATVITQPASAPQHIVNRTQQFSHLHIDLVGPFPVSASGHTHLLAILDRSTLWAEAIPPCSTSAASCTAALVNSWVAQFSVPEQITSDGGRQFRSAVWDTLTHRLGVKIHFNKPYHPQSNGAVERFHCRLKDSLWVRLAAVD